MGLADKSAEGAKNGLRKAHELVHFREEERDAVARLQTARQEGTADRAGVSQELAIGQVKRSAVVLDDRDACGRVGRRDKRRREGAGLRHGGD